MAANHGDECDHNLIFMRDKYIKSSSWTQPQNSAAVAAAEVLSLNIYSHETSLKLLQTSSQSGENNQQLYCEKDHFSFSIFIKMIGNSQ